jgi:hypothetical protein
MHRINNVKVIEAQQARIIHHYKNTKDKLLKTNVAIWFNKMCRLNHLMPNYIHVKDDRNNAQRTHTKNATVR